MRVIASKRPGVKRQVTWTTGAALAALMVMGCSDELEDDDPGRALEAELPRPAIDASADANPHSDAGSAVDVRASGGDAGAAVGVGGYFASVIALGTGCPAGSWDTSISPENEFTFSFHAFEAAVDPSRGVAISNCQLQYRFVGSKRASYRITRPRQSGHVQLEPGVRAVVSTRASVLGASGSRLLQLDRTGPADEGFSVDGADTASGAEDAGWSPCGVDHTVALNTTLRVINSEPRRSGRVRIEKPAEFELESRPCSE